MYQEIQLKCSIISKKKNVTKLKKLLEICQTNIEHKILLHLIVYNKFIKNENDEYDLEAFVHRLGKILNLEFIEKNNEQNENM